MKSLTVEVHDPSAAAQSSRPAEETGALRGA